MKKFNITLLLLLFFTNIIYSQTISGSIEVKETPIGPPPVTSNIATIVEHMNKADVSHLFVYFIIVIILIILGLFIIYKIFAHIFNKVEDFKIGSFSFKMRKKESPIQDNSKKSVDFDTILNIFEFITRTELKVIINDVISSMNEIYSIEEEYDKNVKSVFEKTFSIIERDLHDKLVSLACKVTNFDLMKVKHTREYFFISDLLDEYREVWKEDVKEITRRNGFIEFLTDRTKSEPYINELANAINQCIDMEKLESTDISKSEIDNIIKNSYKDYHNILENMFYNLATMKSKMLNKRSSKMEHIENSINNSSKKIIEDIKYHIFKKINYDNTETSNKEVNKSEEKK